MPQGIDDFTIVPPELTDMAACGLEMYDRLDRLWRMIEQYKMAAPIAIRVVDNTARCIRVIRGTRDQAVCWHLEDVTTAGAPLEREVELPLTVNSQDANGNILKMRLHFRVGGTTKGYLDRTQVRLPVFRSVSPVFSAI